MDEEVVGGIGIAPFTEHNKVCELQKLYLSTKLHGLGLGKKLMETALSFASKHYEKCYLETIRNPISRTNYHGKVEVSREKTHSV